MDLEKKAGTTPAFFSPTANGIFKRINDFGMIDPVRVLLLGVTRG